MVKSLPEIDGRKAHITASGTHMLQILVYRFLVFCPDRLKIHNNLFPNAYLSGYTYIFSNYYCPDFVGQNAAKPRHHIAYDAMVPYSQGNLS